MEVNFDCLMLMRRMDDSCQSSNILHTLCALKTKRPLEDEDEESDGTGEGASSSTAKRIHFHSDDVGSPVVANGSLEAKDTMTMCNRNQTNTGATDRMTPTTVDTNVNTVSCSNVHLPMEGPFMLNLTKSEENSQTESTLDSPVNDDYKENTDEANNLPIDLSRGRKASLSVATHSNGIDGEKKTDFLGNGGTRLVGKNVIKRLREELRNEETKLVLLKKIKQSQLLHRLIKESADSSRMVGGSSQPIPGPPPLIRGLQPVSSAQRTAHQPPEPSRVLVSQQPQHSQGPPPLIVPSRSLAPPLPVVSSARSMQGVVQPVPQSTSTISQSYRSPVSAVLSQHTPAMSSAQPEQSAAQRQAAAKLALRKQLEKTLLQIPPPKPPPPEMNFIPNVGNGDFVTLLGLEEAVKCILDNDARARGESVAEVKYIFNPFQCVQCDTDFTPVWKRDKPGSKNVICERCVTSNQKWALKQEHTNRLKSAFVKALQQEQEIEQSLITQSAVATTTPSSHMTSSSPHPSVSLVPKNLSSAQRSVVEAPHQTSRHHHHHHHHHQQQQAPRHATLWTPPTLSSVVRLSQAFDPRLVFPFHRPPVTSKSPVDIQRQYLLDLIPQRSHLEGPVLWRT